MANNYKTPGVYVEEIPNLPPSIASVETAIPVFIGYTQKAKLKKDDDLRNVPHRIRSIFDYKQFFGEADPESNIKVTINTLATPEEILAENTDPSKHLMFYSVQAFFDNGGGPCYIVSIGDYTSGFIASEFKDVLEEVKKVDEITLILMPDAHGLTSSVDYYDVHNNALQQCKELGDRFTVLDIWMDTDPTVDNIQVMRDSGLGTDINLLKYGAVYYPKVEMTTDYLYENSGVTVDLDGSSTDLASLESSNNQLFNQARAVIDQLPVILPASSPVVGIYANTDDTRGVWKAPANRNISGAIKPTVKITNSTQEDLNVDVTAGKSVNAIRSFTGRGPAIIWGARTLAGNDNEWRYISVRRFFNMAEESIKKASAQFVFEPNDLNTWTRVKSMIENYLSLQWTAGALQGVTPQEAYFVKVGLNETMTELDIWEGRMIVEIGMAVVRPAEFIILRFSHKMLSES